MPDKTTCPSISVTFLWVINSPYTSNETQEKFILLSFFIFKTMRNLLLSFCVFLFVIMVSGCGSVMKTYSYQPKGQKFDEYKTYAWVNLKHFVSEDQENEKRYARFILEHSDAEIRAKGFKLDTISPQVVFQFDTKIEKRVSYNRTPSVSVGIGFGGPGYYVGGAVPVSGGQVIANQYEEGVLTIEMLETQTGRVLWRGWAEEQVSFETDLEEDLQRAIKQIFMRLSVKHKE